MNLALDTRVRLGGNDAARYDARRDNTYVINTITMYLGGVSHRMQAFIHAAYMQIGKCDAAASVSAATQPVVRPLPMLPRSSSPPSRVRAPREHSTFNELWVRTYPARNRKKSGGLGAARPKQYLNANKYKGLGA